MIELVKAFDRIARKLGLTVTYKRFRGETYDPDQGTVKTFWETPTVTIIQGFVTDRMAQLSGGSLAIGDRWIYVRKDAFKQQSGEAKAPEPDPRDEIIFPDGSTWSPVKGAGTKAERPVYEEDPSGTLWKIYLRRAS